MTSNLQIISFLVSFIYGIFFYFLTIINFKLIESLKVYLKHILTFIYTIDMTIIYIIIIYHLNKGYFHIYFIMMVFIGFFIGLVLHKKLLSKIEWPCDCDKTLRWLPKMGTSEATPLRWGRNGNREIRRKKLQGGILWRKQLLCGWKK